MSIILLLIVISYLLYHAIKIIMRLRERKEADE